MITSLAEGIAEWNFAEEVGKHPELASQEKSYIQAQKDEYTTHILNRQKQMQEELKEAAELVKAWYDKLPLIEKEQTEEDLKFATEMYKSVRFSDFLLDQAFNFNEKTMQDSLKINPSLIESLFQEAKRLEEGTEYYKAICLYKMLILFNPKLIKLYHHCGYCYVTLQNFEEALNFFNFSIALAPEDPKGYYLASLCHYEHQEFEAAQLACEAGLELSLAYPDWKNLFNHLRIQIINRGE